MKYFLDCEFHEDGKTIDLISVAIVAEDGRELYMVSNEFDEGYAWSNNWLAENVLPYLKDEVRWSRPFIRNEILRFCDPEKYGTPEFWGYFCDYDWVALCQLFGKMIDLPKGWPMYCRDLKQLGDERKPGKRLKQTGEHHALEDARWNKRMYYFLTDTVPPPDPAMRAACLEAFERGDFIGTVALFSLIHGGHVAWEVSIADDDGKTIWHGVFPQSPTFDEVRRALAVHNHGRAITAWYVFRRFRDTWRPMNPVATEAIFGSEHGSVRITKYYL